MKPGDSLGRWEALAVFAAASVVLAGLLSSCSGGGAGSIAAQFTPPSALLSAGPVTLDFGTVLLGSNNPKTVTLTSTGIGSVTVTQLTVTGTGLSVSGLLLPLTLAAGASTTFSVTFAPDVAGNVAGSVTVVSTATGSPATVAIAGIGAKGGGLSIAPAPTVDFLNVRVGSSRTLPVILTNTGAGRLTVSQITASGIGFTISGPLLPLTLAPGQSNASFGLTFSPASAPGVTGNLSIVSDAVNSPTSVALVGSTPPSALLSAGPVTLDFGTVLLGSNNPKTVTLTSTGIGSVTVTQLTVTGTGFGVSGLSLPLTLAAGASTTFNVTFNPIVAGNVAGSVTVVSTATGSPATVAIAGIGAKGSMLSIAPASTVDFLNVRVGSSSTLPVILTNTGAGKLTISQITASGLGFTISGPSLPLTLAPGQSNASFSLTFTPATAPGVTGNLSIVSDALNSPTSVALFGSAHSVDLAWVASTSPGVVGYNIYRGTASGGPYPQKLNAFPSAGTTLTDWNVQGGKTYFYVATAVDLNTLESQSSAESTPPAAVPSP